MCENCEPRGTECPNCGGDPCYHLCPNSPAYYSPEQERADEPFYGDDDVSERYAGELIGLEDEPGDEIPDEYKQPGGVLLTGMWQGTAPSTDDVPF